MLKKILIGKQQKIPMAIPNQRKLITFRIQYVPIITQKQIKHVKLSIKY